MTRTPAAIAARGVSNVTSVPSKRSRPSSGPWSPERTRSSVDFPAPFSPINASTSPERISSETSSRAVTPEKRLPMPSTASAGEEEDMVALRAVEPRPALSRESAGRGVRSGAVDAGLLVVVLVDDRGLRDRLRGQLLAVLHLVHQHLDRRAADLGAGDVERGLVAGVLAGRPVLAGEVGAEPDADDVVRRDAGVGQRGHDTGLVLVVAAPDHPVLDARVGADHRAGAVLRVDRRVVGADVDHLDTRVAGLRERGLGGVDAVGADAEVLLVGADDLGVGGGPAGGLEQLPGLGADRVTHLAAVEADERGLRAGAVLDDVVGGDDRDARALGLVDHLRADGLVGDDDGDAVRALRDRGVQLGDRLVGVLAEVDDLELDAELLRLLLRPLRLLDEVLLVTLFLQVVEGDLAVGGRRLLRGGGVFAGRARSHQGTGNQTTTNNAPGTEPVRVWGHRCSQGGRSSNGAWGRRWVTRITKHPFVERQAAVSGATPTLRSCIVA